KLPFPRKLKASGVVTRECMRRGLVVYPGGGMADGVDGDNFMVAPPLIVEEGEVREIASRLKGALEAASEALRVGV
ncbi:MAG TPA: aspartate aminotransferase family protein, partial [Thermosynergistes sp.]|nr:aspartate aminotransferase family protein [Thermosynergistes sp.]